MTVKRERPEPKEGCLGTNFCSSLPLTVWILENLNYLPGKKSLPSLIKALHIVIILREALGDFFCGILWHILYKYVYHSGFSRETLISLLFWDRNSIK